MPNALIILLLLQPTTQTNPTTAPIDLKKVVAAAPVLKSPDGGTAEDFQFTCAVRFFNARIRVTKVGDRAAMAVESADGTPILIAADGEALVYDALEGRLLHFTRACPEFRFMQAREKLTFRFGVQSRKADEEVAAEFELDCQSILQRPGLRLEARRADDGAIGLVGFTESSNIVVAHVTADGLRYQRIQLMSLEEKDPVFDIYHIRTGGEVKHDYLTFPDVKLYEHLKVVRVEGQNRDQMTQTVKAILRSLQFRLALEHEPARSDFEKQFSQADLDWDELKRADAKLTAQLRAVERHGAALPIEQPE